MTDPGPGEHGAPAAEGSPPPETPAESRARRHREAEAREAAERDRIERELRARAAAGEATRGDARRLEDAESVRAKQERAERWRQEQERTRREAAERAAAKKEVRAEAKRSERAAAATEKAARKATHATERESSNGAPQPLGDRLEAARTAPSAAELTALARPVDAPPAANPATRPPLSTPASAPPPTSHGRASYSEKYADLEHASAGESRQIVRPRAGLHRLITLLILAALAVTALFAEAAWSEPTVATVGIAAVCAAVVLILWAARASVAPMRVVIDQGVMDVVHRNVRRRFDLSTQYTRVEMVGQPGRPGWRILLGHAGGEPLVLTASQVRSRELTEALRRWRPEL